jgi:hypothetical protein
VHLGSQLSPPDGYPHNCGVERRGVKGALVRKEQARGVPGVEWQLWKGEPPSPNDSCVGYCI